MKRAVLLLALVACGKDQAGRGDAGDHTASDAEVDAPPPTCDPAVDPYGRCAGNTLHTCNAGTPVAVDCGAQVCTWIDDTNGYGCADPASTGALVVTGTIAYEDRPPLDDGSLGPIAPHAARGARVSLIRDADASVLATGSVADDGTYQLHYNATIGEQVHVLASSYNPQAARPIRVTNRQSVVHGFGGPSFAAAASAIADVLVTDASQRSEAFNILDQLVGTMDEIRVALGDATPVPLVAEWQSGSNEGTYYFNGMIHLLGRSADDDGYDDTVILHESGHYVEETQGRTDSPGGSHNGSPTDPRLAWSEGFSTYWGMVVRGAPMYMDSNAGGGWSYNADTSVTAANPSGPITQDVSEDMVTEDLWDLGDGAAGDDDGVASDHTKVVRVQVDYLRPGAFRQVGTTGVDLVDFLDGWFLAAGLAPCAPARDVISGVRMFPYDYAGPAGTCP